VTASLGRGQDVGSGWHALEVCRERADSDLPSRQTSAVRQAQLPTTQPDIYARLTGIFLTAWILFPLVLLLCSWGNGLLIRRLAGGGLSATLVVPVGFALIVAVSAFLTSFAALAPAAGAVVALLAVAGIALGIGAHESSLRQAAGSIRSARWLWPTAAALTAFAAIGGPVFLTSTPTWTGYTRIVDIAFQMDFAKHLADAGRLTPPLDSSYHAMINKLTTTGYPGGGQATLGAMGGLVRTDVPWCYQAYLAFAAAVGALAVFSLLGRVTANLPLRAIAAAVAIQPNLLYGYALEGGIKELTATTLLVVAVAVLAERLPGSGPRRNVLPAAVTLSGAFAAFSFGIAPWLGIVLVGLAVLTVARPSKPRRYVVESWASLAALAAVLSIPSLVSAAKLTTVAGGAFGSVAELGLGNLAAPVPAWSSAGVWLTGDYRFPISHITVTHIFDVVVVVLALLGLGAAVYRRQWAIAMLGLSAPIALLYWIARTGPWLEFKAFTVTGTLALVLAFGGALSLATLQRRTMKLLGWIGVAAIAGVVLYGNAIVYHDTTLAPASRYHDLANIGKRYAGQGPTLMPAFDEYAEYFLRNERETGLVNPAYGRFQLASGVQPPSGVSFSWDLNQIQPAFLQDFRLIVMPRSPVATRPPSNYDLVDQTRYFQVWRQDRPASTVVAHFPLSSLPHERAQTHFCPSFVADVRRAGPTAEVAYAQATPTSVTGLTLGPHPDYWRSAGPDTVIAYGAGTSEVKVPISTSGRYSVWLQGSIGRPLAIRLDGRPLASVGYEERYPNQFLMLDSTTFSAGTHTLRVVRGNGSLHPGSGDPVTDTEGRTIGAFVFSREGTSTDRVQVAPGRDAARVCSTPVGYEWLEILKPGGAPPSAAVSR